MALDRTLYNPARKVDLYCGRPLIVFHDTDSRVLADFCAFIPPWERCTRIVLSEEYLIHEHESVIYVERQLPEEIAIWYASAECVVSHEHIAEAQACGTVCLFGDHIGDRIIQELA